MDSPQEPRHPRRTDYAHWPALRLDVDGETVEFLDYPRIAKDYAEKVVKGEAPANKLVILACKKYLRMLAECAKPDGRYVFSAAHVCDYVSFCELFPLMEDNAAGVETVTFEPWLMFCACAIYGFRFRSNGQQVTKRAYLEVPRKHFKSGTAAMTGLFELTNKGARSPQVLIAASSEKQAERVYSPMRNIIESDDEFRQFYNLKPKGVSIECGNNRGIVKRLTSVGEREDGWNPTFAVMEEVHAQARSTYEVVKSAFAARANSWMLMITTAGRHAMGLGWDVRDEASKALRGEYENDRFFAFICCADKDDDWTDKNVWIKCNPMWGLSVQESEVEEAFRSAKLIPSEKDEFLRTRLNIWGHGASNAIDVGQWLECQREGLSLYDYIGKKCYVGVDLSTKDDLSSIGLVFEEGNDLVVFTKTYVTSDSNAYTHPDLHALMNQWAEDSPEFTVVPASEMDFTLIGEDLNAICEAFQVIALGYDPAQGARVIMEPLARSGVNVMSVKQNSVTFTAPTNDLIARASRGRMVHNGDPSLTWAVGNTMLSKGRNSTVMPIKESEHSHRKIDPFVSLVIANTLRMGLGSTDKTVKVVEPSPYATRALGVDDSEVQWNQ